jgi:hypothetical protein
MDSKNTNREILISKNTHSLERAPEISDPMGDRLRAGVPRDYSELSKDQEFIEYINEHALKGSSAYQGKTPTRANGANYIRQGKYQPYIAEKVDAFHADYLEAKERSQLRQQAELERSLAIPDVEKRSDCKLSDFVTYDRAGKIILKKQV